MIILAIDPGPTQSGWCLWSSDPLIWPVTDIWPNDRLIYRCQVNPIIEKHLVIEGISHYGTGMPVGQSVFDTCEWIGRFRDRWNAEETFHKIMRRDVKLHLCGSVKAKDSNVRQALIDRFGGKEKAIGKKANPGPLYGVKSHAWSALALAITWHEQNERTNDA